MTLSTELAEFVADILREFTQPYPRDIIDRVFQYIATHDNRRIRYSELLATAPHGKYSVNPSIGRMVKEMTGMKTIKYPCTPCDDSKELITTYSLLGHNGD